MINRVAQLRDLTQTKRYTARLVLFVAAVGAIVTFGVALVQTNAYAPSAAFTSGGGHTTSQNFEIVGVIGQPIVGRSSSENFQVDAGVLEKIALNILCVYDTNANGATERPEAIQAVTHYLLGSAGTSRAEAIEVVSAYLLSKSFAC